VRADSAAVAAVLRAIRARLLREGTRLHPGIALAERHNQLTVFCDASAGSPDERLFFLPRELLVPIDGARWSPRTDRLELLAPPPGLDAVQQELLDLHIDLFNAAGKLQDWHDGHPRRAVWDHAAVRNAIEAIRPGAGDVPPCAAEGFLAERSFGLRPHGGRRVEVLMPLIDLLNHHFQGSPYFVDDTAMTIQVAQPDDAECFAHYGGRRDVLELALRYGYLDLRTPFAYSAPLALEVDGIGRIVVLGERLLPAHELDPPRLQLQPDRLEISHLCCDERHPARLVTMLRLALMGAARERGLPAQSADRAAASALAAIGEANLRMLACLVDACRAVQAATPSAAKLVAAAEREAAIIARVFGLARG
jgi:hypothetical protein